MYAHKSSFSHNMVHLCYRLWEDGWKDRYYKNKFDVDSDDIAFRHTVVSYVPYLFLISVVTKVWFFTNHGNNLHSCY